MITRTKRISLSPDLTDIGNPEDILFFDIETTGLSAWKSGLYLIGVLSYAAPAEDGTDNSLWQLTQFFCESVADEVPVLDAFFSLLSRKKVLISFNGEGFDIPFLSAMIAQYGLSYSFDGIRSFDIFKKLKPLKKLLRLDNYRLKTCECFLHIHREDPFTGGELIYIYQDYLKDHAADKLETLLLHNAEDLENLPPVLPILSYTAFLTGDLRLISQEIVTVSLREDGSTKVLSLTYQAPVSVPVPVDLARGRAVLNITGNRLNLCIELYEGELRYFFADYKNYYYLPVEDQAVHKSIGEFVDPAFRTKATAKTCYQRENGLFLPEVSPVFTPVLYREYKGKVMYTPYQESLFSDPVKAQGYLKSILDVLLR